MKVESCAYFLFCFDFHVLYLRSKHDFAIICFDFFNLGNPFAFVIFVFVAISIIYLRHHYISKLIIFNISSIHHFKTCKIKHWLHMLLVIIVNLFENDYVNQITDLLINKKYSWNNELPFKHNNFEVTRCSYPTKIYSSQ